MVTMDETHRRSAACRFCKLFSGLSIAAALILVAAWMMVDVAGGTTNAPGTAAALDDGVAAGVPLSLLAWGVLLYGLSSVRIRDLQA